MTVVDIRGTHGSGKSWIMHQLLAIYTHQPIIEGDTHLGYLLTKPDAALIGRYATVAGGCDGVGTVDEVVRRLRLFASSHRHVLLEGILVSHSFKRYSLIANELGEYHFMFLNTPLATCIARIKARRRAKGNTKPFNAKHTIKDHHAIYHTIRRKAVEAGHTVTVLPYKDPLPPVLENL